MGKYLPTAFLFIVVPPLPEIALVALPSGLKAGKDSIRPPLFPQLRKIGMRCWLWSSVLDVHSHPVKAVNDLGSFIIGFDSFNR